MPNTVLRWFKTIDYPSYVIFFVTSRCNAACKMCFYKENMDSNKAKEELTVDEYDKISRKIETINILGISGGEPFLRKDLSEIVKVIYTNCSPLVLDLPTNGYLTDSVLRNVEDIAKSCTDMIVDIQLSIDGPEEIHDQIRGVEGGFKKVKETYKGLIELKKNYKNLRVKACVVYSHYNQDHIEELFKVLTEEFMELDRVLFSVVHGSVSNDEAWDFEWENYFEICERMRKRSTVKNIFDLHSTFTIALRIAKNDLLKNLLKSKDMYRKCDAGRKVIVINENGKVFPCEPLWSEVGDLRTNGYDIGKVLKSEQMKEFQRKIKDNKCNCHWGLPMSNTILYSPSYYPRILVEMAKITARSIFKRKESLDVL